MDGDFDARFDPEPVLDTLQRQIVHYGGVSHDEERLLLGENSGVILVTSNTTCFTCLRHSPRHILPCDNEPQHLICEECALRFSSSASKETAVINRCPLGCRFGKGKAWKIRLKPPTAGARLLALDGGGIRGIVELCILKEIEKEVGHKIPIQELFDLAIGTSTGGIISLGFFEMDWSIEKAISQFVALVQSNFSKRIWLKIPILGKFAAHLYSHKYEEAGIENALQKAFGDGLLFGYNPSSKSDRVRVGVVACAPTGRRLPFLLTNYARDYADEGDGLVRAEDPSEELRIWEAARSTSAAPGYFDHYYHRETGQTYVDGALLRNNPVQLPEDERHQIWPGDQTSPDMILSIGTGVQRSSEGVPSTPTTTGLIYNAFIPKCLRGKVALVKNVIKSTLNCEKQWEEFQASHRNLRRISHRLDLQLSHEPPQLDDIGAIKELGYAVEKYFRKGSADGYTISRYKSPYEHIAEIARQLIAALFYFDYQVIVHETKVTVFEGVIRCRLSPNMAKQYKILLQSEPKFRLRHVKRHIISLLDIKFRSGEFSSHPIQLGEHTGDHAIEMRLAYWPKDIWARIAGYSAVGSD